MVLQELLTSKLLDLSKIDDNLDFEKTSKFAVEGIEGDWFDDDDVLLSSQLKLSEQSLLQAEEQRIATEVRYPELFFVNNIYH